MKTKEGESGYKFFRFILGPIFKLYYNPKIIGKEFIPKEGPILIAGNHRHLYDQCLAVIATKRVIHYMAKKEHIDGKFGWFFKSCGCIRVDRSIKDETAKSQALEVLNNDGAIGIFPEGTRNRTEAFLLPFKFGVVSMASKSNAIIVPFGLTGDYKFRSKNLTIRFGEPFQVGNMTLEEANKKLEEEVGNLMKQSIKKSKIK